MPIHTRSVCRNRRKDVVVRGRNMMARRIIRLRQIVDRKKPAPLVFAVLSRNRQQPGPVLAHRRKTRRDPSDIALRIGVNDIFRRHFEARDRAAKLVPIRSPRDRQSRQIACRPGFRCHRPQSVSAMVRKVLANHGTMNRVMQFHGLGLHAFHRNVLPLDLHLFPLALIPILQRVLRIERIHVQVFLIHTDDGETERDVFVVPQANSRQTVCPRRWRPNPERPGALFYAATESGSHDADRSPAACRSPSWSRPPPSYSLASAEDQRFRELRKILKNVRCYCRKIDALRGI